MASLTTFDSCADKDIESGQETMMHSPEKTFSGSAEVSNKVEENNSVGLKEVPEPSRTRMAVTMIACLYLHMSSFGMIGVLGVLYVELIAYFDAPRSEAALVQNVYFGLRMGGGILFTRPLIKYDTGLIMAASSFLATISFCAIGFVPSIHVVILLTGITGLVISMNIIGAFIVTSWMFQKRRKAALATLTTGVMVGLIFLPYVAIAAIDTYSRQGAVIILGAMLYLNCIPCGILIHFSKPYFNKGNAPKITQNICFDLSLFSDLKFMTFLFIYLTFSATGPVEQWFAVDMSVLKGFTAGAGATLLSLTGLSALTGSYIGALLLMCFPNTRQELHMAYAFFTCAISHIIISQSKVYWGMVLGIIMRGLSVGILVSFLPGLQIDLRGLERYPQTVAVSSVVSGIGAILGGFLGGLSVDVTKNYDFTFFIASGVNTLNAISVLSMFVISKFRRSRLSYENLK